MFYHAIHLRKRYKWLWKSRWDDEIFIYVSINSHCCRIIIPSGNIVSIALATHDADTPGQSENAASGLKNADNGLHESGPNGGAAQDDEFHEGTNNVGFTCQGFFDDGDACGGIE